MNINYDATDVYQKRVLICYLNIINEDFDKSSHGNYYHMNQMIHYFVSRDFCVDICGCNEIRALPYLNNHKYAIIIGFGEVFKHYLVQNIPLKVLFVTENDPEIVKIRYNERLEYFKERHPNSYCYSEIRDGYYDSIQFEKSDCAIVMNSEFNAKSMRKKQRNIWTINSNCVINSSFVFDEKYNKDTISQYKTKFLWFGSRGIIHKGLDILIDVFRDHPEWELDVYGLRKTEKKLFNTIKAGNTIDCGYVNVHSKSFIDNVVNKHVFLLFPSCSEGMSTGVATCMAHGMIPIVTKECGFEPNESIIEFLSYKKEDVESKIMEVLTKKDDEILSLRSKVYNYARQSFSIKAFDCRFTEIMDDILKSKKTI